MKRDIVGLNVVQKRNNSLTFPSFARSSRKGYLLRACCILFGCLNKFLKLGCRRIRFRCCRMGFDWSERPIQWTYVERLFKCSLQEQVTGEHRHFMCGKHALVTGPRSDYPVQQSCLTVFVLFLVIWTILSGFIVAETNPLLCLAVYLAWLFVSDDYFP